MNKEEMGAKHYFRLKGFLKFNIEERELEEQKIILEQAIKVAMDILKDLETK